MAHEHKQRDKSDEPGAKGGSVAVQTAPEQSAIGGLQALPGLSFDALNTLQGSIGNAAIGRMVRASNVATAERPTPVSEDTQDAIDAQKSGGEAMAAGVRVHSSPPADNLARSLNANAFTQGRDVFLGANAGRETLAHEMTHLGQGAPTSGAVMREPTIPAPVSDPEAQPGASMGPEGGEVRYVDRLPTIGEPGVRYIVKSMAQKQADKRYNLYFAMYDKPIIVDNLTPAQIVERLRWIWGSYHNDLDNGRKENLRLKANREDHWVAGFWSDTFGGVELPDEEMWNEVGRGPLADAMQVLQATDAVLQERWAANEAAIQRNIDPALMNNPYMQDALAFDATQERVTEAIRHLEEARRQLIECENKVEEYREGTIKGASRAITGIKVSIVILSAAAGGEGAGFAGQGAGLGAKAIAGAGTSGFIGASDEFFTQVGEMRIGERADWDFDFGKIAKRGVKDTVTAFVGAVVGGKFSSVLGGKYTKWVYGLDETMLASQGLTKDMLLGKGEQLVIDWVAGLGASPFTTASSTAMSLALDEKQEIHSFGDFAGKVWDDMEQGGALDGLLKLAGSRFGNPSIKSASEGGGGRSEPTTTRVSGESSPATTQAEAGGGGGGGSTPATSTPEATGGGSNGVPEHIGPEGDANLSPDVSTGVPEPIGPGYEPTQPQGDTTEPTVTGTEPTEPVASNGVPEPVGPEGDAPLSPDVSTGVPEPVGPAYEPTQPQGDATQPTVTGTEPTAPIASNGGVPEHIGPEGDAYYSPDAAKNESNGPTNDAQNGSGGGGPAGGRSGGGPGRRDTLPGMGAAGPAGENAPPRPTVGDTLPGIGDAGPVRENIADAADTQPMAAQEQPRRFSETSEPVESFSRAPDNRMSVSGYSGSLPEGYGVFRTRVRLASGEVVEAVVKIYPGEQASKFNSEVAGAQAAAATGMGPEFYGQVAVPTDAQYARPGTNDLAFAMEPVQGAFARHGSEPGQPGHEQAVAESAAAAARIGDQTIQNVRDFARAILDQGYYYGGSHGGEVQGLIGPNGEWTPIDFQGLTPLPPAQDRAAYDEAIREHEVWVDDEIDNLERARRDSEGFPDEDPTLH